MLLFFKGENILRLDKFLVTMNVGSRTELKKIIKNGQIKVNGIISTKPEEKIDEDKDCIKFNEEIITYEPYVYYMLNKPQNTVSATIDNTAKTVVELLKAENRTDIFPIGRLDKDTEGLLLLTNDGSFAHKIISPSKKVYKTYFAIVEGEITKNHIEQFAKGFSIEDDKNTLPAILKIGLTKAKETEVTISICEGRYHQIKRMFHAIGSKVLYLKRISIGDLLLDETLPLGGYRPLTKEERELLC